MALPGFAPLADRPIATLFRLPLAGRASGQLAAEDVRRTLEHRQAWRKRRRAQWELDRTAARERATEQKAYDDAILAQAIELAEVIGILQEQEAERYAQDEEEALLLLMAA